MPNLEALSCIICFEQYRLPDREPLVLVCGHTFCRSCVSALFAHSSHHADLPPSSFAYRYPQVTMSVTCPTCRVRSDHKRISINYSLREAIAPGPDDGPGASGRRGSAFLDHEHPVDDFRATHPVFNAMFGGPVAGVPPPRPGTTPTPMVDRRSLAYWSRQEMLSSGRPRSIPPQLRGVYIQDTGDMVRADTEQRDIQEALRRSLDEQQASARPQRAYAGEDSNDEELSEALRRSVLEVGGCAADRALSASSRTSSAAAPQSRASSHATAQSAASWGSRSCENQRRASVSAAGAPQSLASWHSRRAESSAGAAVSSAPECTLPVPAVEPPTAEDTSIDIEIVASAVGTSAAGAPAEVMVSLQPPQGKRRTPSDICCIVDVSDSMGAADQGPSRGANLLDIVRQSLKAMVRNLGDEDRLAVVAYAKSARVVLALTPMCEEGRSLAELSLNDLKLDGLTNMWAGLQAGVELLAKSSTPGRLQHVLLLTDGVPSISPPRGEAAMLRRLHTRSAEGCLPCTVSTFGIGHDIDSGLLAELATIGAGTYSFIPDAGFVGTVFTNAISNILVTMATNVTLRLEPLSGASFAHKGVLGGHSFRLDQQSGAIEVDLGSCLFGQSRDVLVSMDLPVAADREYLKATLQYRTRERGPPVEYVAFGSRSTTTGTPEVDCLRARVTFVEGVQSAIDAMRLTSMDKMQGVDRPVQKVQHQIAELADRIARMPVAGSDRITKGLLAELRGEVSNAFSGEEEYLTWGLHYLSSLVSAHVHQQCNNFKDPGVQCYGGQLFQEVRDRADIVFCSLQGHGRVDCARPHRRAGSERCASDSPSTERDVAARAASDDRSRQPAPASREDAGTARPAQSGQSFIAKLAASLGCGQCGSPEIETEVESSGP